MGKTVVLNPKTGMTYKLVKPKKTETILKGFSNSYITKPVRDPKTDIFAEALWNYPDLLATLVHNKTAYSCYFPVFVDGKIYLPCFRLESSIHKIMSSITELKPDLVYSREEVERCLSLAIAKLRGSFYASAGHD